MRSFKHMILMQPALVPLLDDRMSTDGTSGPGVAPMGLPVLVPVIRPMGLRYGISSMPLMPVKFSFIEDSVDSIIKSEFCSITACEVADCTTTAYCCSQQIV